MGRRRLLVTLAVLLAAAGGLGGLLYLLVRYESAWYVEAALPPGKMRTDLSQEFHAELWAFINAVSGDQEWFGKFRQEQINSYFEEGFVESGLDRGVLPDAISALRLRIEPDKLRLGFRYGSGAWSTIITLDLRVWLPAGEPNVLALELVGLHAGVVPIKALSLLERIAQAARDNNIEVTWYRYNGHPVALIRFQADQPRVTMRLQDISLADGSLMIRGSSPEGTPARVLVPLVEQPASGPKTRTNQ
jgi:hypothetical protein